MSLPYFNLYPTDFEADTSHLTLAEDGAYNRLLRLCWMMPGCSLPDDNAWIMRRMRVDEETFANVVLVVLNEFFTRKNGRVSNARIAREFAASSEAHKKRVSAGKRGGIAKALKTNISEPSNAKAMLKQPEPEPEPEPKATTSVVAAPRDASPIQSEIDPTDRERLLSAMGADASGMVGPNGKRIGTSADMVIAAKWSEHLSIEEQCRLISERTAAAKAKHAAFAPNSFNYFTAAMADLVATKAQPMPQGSATGSKSDRDNQMQRWNKLGRKTA